MRDTLEDLEEQKGKKKWFSYTIISKRRKGRNKRGLILKEGNDKQKNKDHCSRNHT